MLWETPLDFYLQLAKLLSMGKLLPELKILMQIMCLLTKVMTPIFLLKSLSVVEWDQWYRFN
ncbi:hypothetical protein EOPP23_06540 [Endozoicomonas sp. OPT23]|nr:hypothetical protein [Endozoicomonas sp. OPT23]